jgi:hypothetical protein
MLRDGFLPPFRHYIFMMWRGWRFYMTVEFLTVICTTSITPYRLMVDNIDGMTETEKEILCRLRGTRRKDIRSDDEDILVGQLDDILQISFHAEVFLFQK